MKRLRLSALFIALYVLAFGMIRADEPESILDVPGRIAYIGADYNVYTTSLHDEVLHQLTDDSSSLRRYQWPTWADNDMLAYFCCAPLFGAPSVTDVHISADGVTRGESVYRESGEVFNYAYWSPRDCEGSDVCRDLALLISRGNSLAVELIHVTSIETSSRTIGTGAPFYYSWSPDGSRMLLQRNNRRFDVLDVDQGELQRLDQTPGFIQAPWWSPVDDRLLIGVQNADGGSTDLAVLANEELTIFQEELPGPVSYSWSPDGNQFAFRAIFEDAIGSLIVMDSLTGEVVAQTSADEVLAFFWSPDSKHIAYLTFTEPSGSFSASRAIQISNQAQQQEIELSWSVLDVESGTIRRYSSFLPTEEMVYIISFFDQFAQSHRIWSPDSSHIVFSEFDGDRNPIINVLDMTRADTVPFYVADGVIGIWSFQ